MPEVSVTVQVTVVIPIGKDAGASLFTDSISTKSSTAGWPKSTKFSEISTASSSISEGDTIEGDVVSITDTICSAIAIFP